MLDKAPRFTTLMSNIALSNDVQNPLAATSIRAPSLMFEPGGRVLLPTGSRRGSVSTLQATFSSRLAVASWMVSDAYKSTSFTN